MFFSCIVILWSCLGVIYAEAKTRCGSHEELLASVARNEVKKIRHNNIDWYMFPKFEVTNNQKIQKRTDIQRSTGISNDQFGEIQNTMDNLVFSDEPAEPASIECILD